MRRLTTIIALAMLSVSALQAGPIRLNIFKNRKGKQTTTQQNIVTVYDTVRVVVTDTIRVEPKAAPRIDTLQLAHTPEQIDSLLDLWHTMSLEQSHKSYFEPYSAATEGESNMAVDSLYRSRLQDLVSPVHLPYNYIVRDYINYYLTNRWSPLSNVLALAKFYFPIFEQELIAANMPIELRALAIIESNLSPLAASRVGAVGLWQFMPATGKNLGLEINSLVDERSDIILSTRAACRFLKDLYRMFGDWTLALAAYNCGPGNVNKAIRRSGGKRDYWAIYPFLPRETRGYVPAFIAATYTMTYYAEHKICPANIQFPLACDTVHTTKRMSLQQIAAILGQDVEILRNLNPQYRRDIIPGSKDYTICLPSSAVNGFIEHEDTICNYKKEELCPQRIQVEPASYGRGYYGPSNGRVYRVRQGDTLGAIARRNRVSVAQIKRWNNLRSDKLSIGQRLIVR